MPAEQSCARSGACGLAGEERDHIYYIPPDQTEPGPGNILNIFSNTNQNDFVIYFTSCDNGQNKCIQQKIFKYVQDSKQYVRLTPLLSSEPSVG